MKKKVKCNIRVNFGVNFASISLFLHPGFFLSLDCCEFCDRIVSYPFLGRKVGKEQRRLCSSCVKDILNWGIEKIIEMEKKGETTGEAVLRKIEEGKR